MEYAHHLVLFRQPIQPIVYYVFYTKMNTLQTIGCDVTQTHRKKQKQRSPDDSEQKHAAANGLFNMFCGAGKSHSESCVMMKKAMRYPVNR